ncbi:MAG: hypothetical protein LDL19_04995 [Thiobacillus sp.]|nr:hypothetical protein [Thiobacillus sp.]
MTSPPSPIDDLGRFSVRPVPERTLGELLRLIAQSVRADAIQLGIDLGTGYRRDCFLAQGLDPCLPAGHVHTAPPFVILRESRVHRPPSPSGLVAAPDRVVQSPLALGTPGRRAAPRSGIGLLRGPDRPAFTSSERRALDRVLPHLDIALGLAFDLECARQRQISTQAMLEHANCGCLLLGQDGELLFGNRLALDLLGQMRARAERRLLLPSRAMQAQFDDALRRAARGEPATLVVPGPPVVALCFQAPLDLPSAGGAPAREIVLILRSPAAARLPESLAGHFRLTPAEFRLAAALAEGATLKACAHAWHRSYGTLRSQLKSLLEKTGTHRQSELIALLGAFRTPV